MAVSIASAALERTVITVSIVEREDGVNGE